MPTDSPGSATTRGPRLVPLWNPLAETPLFVLYDVESDRVRHRISEACKDFGLVSFQYSVFAGYLTRTKREELFLRLRREIGDSPGTVTVLPIPADSLRRAATTGEPLGLSHLPIAQFL